MGVSTKAKSSHPKGWAFPQNHAAGWVQALKGTNWILRIPRIKKQRLIYDLKIMHDFSRMSCHDDIRSMCCVQIKSNMQDGLDRIQFNWIIHAQITNLRGAPKAPRSFAPPTAEGGGFQGPPWGPGPWGVLLYTLLFNMKLAPGASDLYDPIGTRMFDARLGSIKVDGNNPQG